MDAIEALPEFDKPAYFGLPENIERSTQRIVSQQVISQLKILQRSDAQASKFDKEVWASELGPILNLWKKVNQVSAWFPFNLKALLISSNALFQGLST